MDFPFGPWEPDKGELNSMVVADNVLPQAVGYGPAASLYTPSTATALPAAPHGIASIVLDGGTWRLFGFTASAFYQLDATYAWGTAIASGYSCPTDYDWSVLHFGTKMLFTNTTDGLLSYDVETPAGVTAITAAGAPAFIFTCQNYVVALNCLDSTATRNNRLMKVSAINDQTNWTTAGADYQVFADGGEQLCGFDIGGGQALILQQRALTIANFAVWPFTLQKVSDGKGPVHARCCVSFDGMVFFYASDGFYMYAAGSLQPIGAEKVNRWFRDQVDEAHLELIRASIDPLQKIVWWSYKRSIDASETVQEVLLGFDWQLQRWVTGTEQTAALTRLATVGVTWDAATGTWAAQTLTWDDRSLLGTEPLFGALDENLKFGLFTGTSAAATLTTNVANSPVTGLISWATPLTDADAPTIELGVRDRLSSATTWKTAASVVASGRAPLRGRGKNIQFRLNIPAADGWSYASGIDHVSASTGGPK